jgi:hypothetical protein
VSQFSPFNTSDIFKRSLLESRSCIPGKPGFLVSSETRRKPELPAFKGGLYLIIFSTNSKNLTKTSNLYKNTLQAKNKNLLPFPIANSQFPRRKRAVNSCKKTQN